MTPKAQTAKEKKIINRTISNKNFWAEEKTLNSERATCAMGEYICKQYI
jgi:hypothetical protein